MQILKETQKIFSKSQREILKSKRILRNLKESESEKQSLNEIQKTNKKTLRDLNESFKKKPKKAISKIKQTKLKTKHTQNGSSPQKFFKNLSIVQISLINSKKNKFK